MRIMDFHKNTDPNILGACFELLGTVNQGLLHLLTINQNDQLGQLGIKKIIFIYEMHD